MAISRKQIVKSVVLTLLGATPGLLVWANARSTQGLVLCGLGTFIGFAFSLPGVSPSRVAGLTAGVIVAHNVPGPFKQKLMDQFTAENEDSPTAPPSGGTSHADSGGAM